MKFLFLVLDREGVPVAVFDEQADAEHRVERRNSQGLFGYTIEAVPHFPASQGAE
ncbi:hypothetical protein [Nocardia africana]